MLLAKFTTRQRRYNGASMANDSEANNNSRSSKHTLDLSDRISDESNLTTVTVTVFFDPAVPL
jgi:hypothetical protein